MDSTERHGDDELLQPVPVSRLRGGAIYFTIGYADRELCVPTLEPMVFLGRDIEHVAEGLCFQDVESYLAGRRVGDGQRGHMDVLIFAEGDNEALEYQQALRALEKCGRRRADRGMV